MQVIQLYIEDSPVELFKDESISITDSIKSVKDIAKVFTAFTKTFTVPASKNNNKIFKHYYNFDIIDGFDARTKKAANIELNNLPFKKGKIKLEGVQMKGNKPYAYKITFFGETVDLKDLVGEDKLNQLTSLNSLSLDYNSATVKSKLLADPTSTNIIAPLITHTERLYYRSSANTGTDGNLWYHTGSGQVHEHGVLWSELKYAVNQRSPFADEFKGDAKLEHIVFNDGVLAVPKEKQTLQKLLSLYHPLRNKKYIEVDNVKQAENELDYLELEIEALSIAKSLDIDHMEAIMRTEVGSAVLKMTSKELKRDLLLFARSNPALFMELVSDENLNVRNLGIKAVEQGIIKLSNDQRTFTWGSNDRKLITVPFDENPYSALAAYFKTDDGIEIYQTIEKRLA